MKWGEFVPIFSLMGIVFAALNFECLQVLEVARIPSRAAGEEGR